MDGYSRIFGRGDVPVSGIIHDYELSVFYPVYSITKHSNTSTIDLNYYEYDESSRGFVNNKYTVSYDDISFQDLYMQQTKPSN